MQSTAISSIISALMTARLLPIGVLLIPVILATNNPVLAADRVRWLSAPLERPPDTETLDNQRSRAFIKAITAST
jgi:hypothetical protein